jgi:hypothetical protein
MRARAAAIALAVTSLALFAAGGLTQMQRGESRPISELLLGLLVLAVATLLTIRRPGHRVGWFFAISAHGFAWMWMPVPATGSPNLLVLAMTWVQSWMWFVAFGLPVTFALLFFPDGRLPSRRWRWPLRLLAGCFALAALTATFMPYEVIGMGVPFENPLAQPALLAVLDPLHVVGLLGIVAGFFASTASLVVRFRRSRGVERQQMKAVAFGTSVGLAAIPVFLGADLLGLLPDGASGWTYILAIGMPTASIAVAVLRYRLFDIDRVISRTLAYGLVTATLAGMYVGGVVLLTPAVAGFGGGSTAAVAVSTLAVAAAFGPVRRRVQGAVDRRFNRARYDAGRTVEAFRSRLRDEVDLDELHVALREAVEQTVEPDGVRVWLRGAAP